MNSHIVGGGVYPDDGVETGVGDPRCPVGAGDDSVRGGAAAKRYLAEPSVGGIEIPERTRPLRGVPDTSVGCWGHVVRVGPREALKTGFDRGRFGFVGAFLRGR